MNFPAQETCDSEKPWGCDYNDVKDLFERIQKKTIPLSDVKAGESIYKDANIDFSVLIAFDGVNTPVGKTDINDMSLVMKLTNGATSVLFTGDLNRKLGNYLAEKFSKDLKSTLLKIPHHGATALPGPPFFEAVDPQIAFAPASKQLWADERSEQVRDFVKKWQIPVLVSGSHGHVTTLIRPKGFEVRTASERFSGRSDQK